METIGMVGPRDASKILAPVTGILMLAKSAQSAGPIVKTGEMGVRTRFGKVVYKDVWVDDPEADAGRRKERMAKILGPGIHFALPWAHSIQKVSVQDRTSNLEVGNFDRERQYTAKSSITWRVRADNDSPYRALFGPENGSLGSVVVDICSNGFLNTLMDDNIPEKELYNAQVLFEPLQEKCREPLAEYGVELRRLSIASCALSLGEKISTSSGAGPGLIAASMESQKPDPDGPPHLRIVQDPAP